MNEGGALERYLCKYLSYTHSEEEARELALALSSKYGAISYIASSSIDELMSIRGLSRSAALSLKLLSYVYSRSITDSFEFGKRHSEEEIIEYLRALFVGRSIETVYCLLLDGQGRVISAEFIGEGTVNTSDVYPRRVLERSCSAGAAAVIMAHNHPKGTAQPSSADMLGTSYLKHVLAISGIKLVAHYLVTERECNKINLYEG